MQFGLDICCRSSMFNETYGGELVYRILNSEGKNGKLKLKNNSFRAGLKAKSLLVFPEVFEGQI